MKMNKKGFILVETIIISTVVMTVLLILYVQLNSIDNSYNKTLVYDNVDKLYLTDVIGDFLKQESFENLLASTSYLDVTDCSSFTNYAYCETLFTSLDVNKVIISEGDLTNIKNDVSTLSYNQTFKDYINYINGKSDGFMVLVEFNNLEYTSLKVGV